uniref:peptidylprolyl isomerase n=1 Tax=Corethron hystrix TaxID=216773 RepID=A0A7S1BW17_9STRA|mmetsp:Transcript_43246/g.101391  ORF Transcript_43246/g.101391 Transcript_43246/m.101391 type:complete len:131 (+) Transcript_43246:105-497(+)
MPHNLLHSLLLPLLLACLSSAPHRVAAKQGDGTDLPPDSPIRIGVKKRPLDCPRRTTSGDSLSMHYTGSLYKDNKKFDSSYDRDEPFKFVVGSGQVIKGWDQVRLVSARAPPSVAGSNLVAVRRAAPRVS